MSQNRIADHPVDSRFPARWSPRAFDPRPISAAQLASLFEAARWSPSCMNSQPWRFVYAMRDTDAWSRFVDLMNPGNQAWARNASVLVVVCSYGMMVSPTQPGPVPSPTSSFDTGAAWMALALQAMDMGLRTHAMIGFDRERAAREVGLPEAHKVEAMIAIGWPGDKSKLSEALQARELPNARQPVAKFAFEARFG